VARQKFVCMAPGVMVTVSKCEKVFWVHVGKTEDNFILSIRWCRIETISTAEHFVSQYFIKLKLQYILSFFDTIVYTLAYTVGNGLLNKSFNTLFTRAETIIFHLCTQCLQCFDTRCIRPIIKKCADMLMVVMWLKLLHILEFCCR